MTTNLTDMNKFINSKSRTDWFLHKNLETIQGNLYKLEKGK